MRIKLKHIVFISILSFIGVGTTSFMLQTPTATFKDSNAKIKAIYIYNFAINTNWPSEMKKGNFKIGVYGNYKSLIQNFSKLSQTKKVGQQTIQTQNFTSIDEIEDCHILYVDTEKSADFDKILSKLKDKPTLILSDKSGYGQKGGCINFYSAQNKQKFEINKGAFNQHHLQVSSKLIDLADAVY